MPYNKSKFTRSQQRVMERWARSRNAKEWSPDVYYGMQAGHDKNLYDEFALTNMNRAYEWLDRRISLGVALVATPFVFMWAFSYPPVTQEEPLNTDKQISVTEQQATPTTTHDSATIDFATAMQMFQTPDR